MSRYTPQTHPLFRSLQGLAPSPDGRFLFLADYSRGILRVSLDDGAVVRVADAPGASSRGCDGIVLHHGAIVAVQNGASPARVVRFALAPSGDSITSAHVLLRDPALAPEPTIGTMLGLTVASGAFATGRGRGTRGGERPAGHRQPEHRAGRTSRARHARRRARRRRGGVPAGGAGRSRRAHPRARRAREGAIGPVATPARAGGHDAAALAAEPHRLGAHVQRFPAFDGIGFTVAGEARALDGGSYVLLADLVIDGARVETVELPTDFTTRRYVPFFRYELPRGHHSVTIRLRNPDAHAALALERVIVYDSPGSARAAGRR